MHHPLSSAPTTPPPGARPPRASRQTTPPHSLESRLARLGLALACATLLLGGRTLFECAGAMVAIQLALKRGFNETK